MLDSFLSKEDIGTFDELVTKSKKYLSPDWEDVPTKTNNKYDILRIIDKGYEVLPMAYQESFLDPLRNYIETHDYDSILGAFSGGENDVLDDYISCIVQRSQEGDDTKTNDLSLPTMAFTELCADIFDGYISSSVRKDARLPDYQILPPLTRWGGTEAYTRSMRTGKRFGMNMSVIILPKSFSQNIILWPLSVHECYHDVVDAYEGLLNEVEDLISDAFDSPGVKDEFNQNMNWNGEECQSIAQFAGKYWRRTMNETLADVCGLLNIGPTAGISFAILAIGESNNRNIEASSYIDDAHPNTLLRLAIAREVTKRLDGLDMKVREAYSGFFDRLIEKYMYKTDSFVLYSTIDGGAKHSDYIIPLESMLKTVGILVEKIAFTRLKSIGNHSLSEINSWTNRDQVLVHRIATELLHLQENELPDLSAGPDKQEVYSAHVVAAAALAIVKKPEIPLITGLAVRSLYELYKSDPLWSGLPVWYRSDAEKHTPM
jgi:hypothetical protein